jgi:hypothetical protein
MFSTGGNFGKLAHVFQSHKSLLSINTSVSIKQSL